MGPELGLIKAPEKVQEYSRTTAGNNMRALSAHLKKISTRTSLMATKDLKEIASGNSDMEAASGSGKMGVPNRGSTPKTTRGTPSPGPLGIEPESEASAGERRCKDSSAAPLGPSWESAQEAFSQLEGFRSSFGFRAFDYRSQFEAQVVLRARSVQDAPGDPESVVDPPRPKRQVVTGCGQQGPGTLPDVGSPLLQKQRREVVEDRDHGLSPVSFNNCLILALDIGLISASPTGPFQGDWRKQASLASPLGILPPPPKTEVIAPSLPSHRRLRILIDEGENDEREPLNG